MDIQAIEHLLDDIEKRIDNCCIDNAKVLLPFDSETKQFVEIRKISELEHKAFYNLVKRCFDIVASFVALVIFSIPMLIVAILIKHDSKGPVIYKQERVGFQGKIFNIYKFRSMRIDAEKNGAQWAASGEDERITRIGHLLRKTRLDELPQLFNILKGDMSFVGPRPERPVYYKAFRKYMSGFEQRLLVKPGLTGWAQVNGGYDIEPDEKCHLDLDYIERRSFLMDLKILFMTVGVVFTHDGAR